MLFNLISLQLKLWTRGDGILYFYIGCLVAFIIIYLLSFELISQIVLFLGNIYLAILYNRDKELSIFYNILNINSFSSHLAKIIGIYALSLVEIIILLLLNSDDNYLLVFTTHFLAFYTGLLFFNFPSWLKMLSFLLSFLIISVVLSITHFYLSAIIILILDTVILKIIINEFRSQKHSYII